MTDVAVILPALNEEGSVQDVVQGFARHGARVVVVDNGSTDATAARARDAGATVVHEPRRGYGAACLAGLRALESDPPEVVVFADCDGTIDPADLPALVAPIEHDEADLVLGNRTDIDPGALPGKNQVARVVARLTFRTLYGLKIHDLGPFRAVRWSTTRALHLRHPTYGLPVETVARAARVKARIVEVDTRYLNRSAGQSKVGANPFQAAWVGLVMLWVPLRIRLARPRGTHRGTIVVFARTPERGAVKTRLAARYGDDRALELHRAFLADTLEAARQTGAQVILARTPGPACEEERLAHHVVVQRGDTFGRRFDGVLRDAHRIAGREPYLLVGSDTPHLSPRAMRDALDRLRRDGAVYGPNDGHGFYAIGFRGEPVSVASVFAQDDECAALDSILEAAGRRVVRLPVFYDLDVPEDVARLTNELAARRTDWIPPRTEGLLCTEPRVVG